MEEEHFIDALEADCEAALRQVVEDYVEGVSGQTLHLMAKAAVAV